MDIEYRLYKYKPCVGIEYGNGWAWDSDQTAAMVAGGIKHVIEYNYEVIKKGEKLEDILKFLEKKELNFFDDEGEYVCHLYKIEKYYEEDDFWYNAKIEIKTLENFKSTVEDSPFEKHLDTSRNHSNLLKSIYVYMEVAYEMENKLNENSNSIF